MTAKAYLSQVWRINIQLKRIQLQIQDANAMLYMVRSPSDLTRDRVQTSPDGDRVARIVAKIDGLQKELLQKAESLVDAKRKITAEIEGLENERHKSVLYRRYVLFQKWEAISNEMSLDLRYVYRIHGRALNEFQRMYLDH